MEKKKCYESLGLAVIIQAVDDYKKALRGHDKWEIKSLERFFHSDWFVLLSGGADPDYILDRVFYMKNNVNKINPRKPSSYLQYKRDER